MQVIPKLVYNVYEKKLYSEIKNKPVPHHVAIILDGNRRGSKLLGVSYENGYELGAKKLEEVLDWAWEIGVKIVTVWVFSTENFFRPKEQVETIMRLAREKLISIRENPRIHKNAVKVNILGRISLLPKEVQEEIKKTTEATANNSKYVLNVCMAYGGRAEIVDALKEIINKAKEGIIDYDDVDEDLIAEHLYTSNIPDPDLIIRTSGEERLSGFLLWQSAYSEFYFTEVHWPLFRKIDFWRAIRTYQQRHRRYGK